MVQEIIFKASTDTGNSNAKIKELEESLKDAKKESDKYIKSLEEIKARVDSGSLSMREMAKEVKNYQTIALNAGRETPIGQYAISQAAELTDKLGDLRTEINNTAHDGKKLQGAMQIGGGIVAGYGALQGAMALVGSNSEALQKTLVKLQAIQAILAGIEQVRLVLEKESSAMILIRSTRTKVLTAIETTYATAVGTTTGAMKALRLAMLALPIVALIAGIVALVMWVNSLSDSSEELKASNDELINSYNKLNDAMSRNESRAKTVAERQIELAKAQGKSFEDVNKMEIKALEDAEGRRKAAYIRVVNQLNDLELSKFNARNKGNEEETKRLNEELSKVKKQKYDLASLESEYQFQIKLKKQEAINKEIETEEEARQKQLDAQKKYNELSKAERERISKLKIEEQRAYEDLVVANIENANEREIADLALKQKRELDSVREKYGKKSRLISELEEKQTNEMLALIDKQDEDFNKKQDDQIAVERQKELDVQNQYFADKKANAEARLLQIEEDFYAEQELKLELAQIELETQLANEKLTADEKFLIQEEYNRKVRDIEKETAEHNNKLKQEEIDNAINITNQSVQAMAGLTNAFFEMKLSKVKKGSAEEEAIARKAFKVNKALQITQATIQGVQATLAAYSSGSAIPIVGAVTGPLFAAAAAITTGLQIAKIKNAQFEGGANSPTSISAPSVNIPNTNEVNTTNLLPDQITNTGGLAGTGVVIVDSDIKTGLNNLDKVSVISTFG